MQVSGTSWKLEPIMCSTFLRTQTGDFIEMPRCLITYRRFEGKLSLCVFLRRQNKGFIKNKGFTGDLAWDKMERKSTFRLSFWWKCSVSSFVLGNFNAVYE